jgi:hypothetical protein
VRALIELLEDRAKAKTEGDNKVLLIFVAEALGKQGPAAKDAVPRLKMLADHPIPGLKRAAGEALALIEAKKSVRK